MARLIKFIVIENIFYLIIIFNFIIELNNYIN